MSRIKRLREEIYRKMEERNEQYRKACEAQGGFALAQPPTGNTGGAPQIAAPAGIAHPYASQEARAYQAAIAIQQSRAADQQKMMLIRAQQAQQYQNMRMAQHAQIPFGQIIATQDLPVQLPKKVPLERLTLEIGELIGHRAWKVLPKLRLQSLATSAIWQPNVPMKDTTLEDGRKVIDDHNNVGVWAFKDPYELANQFKINFEASSPAWIVFGTVWMWGSVIEHEKGYRSQYASVRSLDKATKEVNLEALRGVYLTQEVK